jgi:carboxymethylenebutenolidase
MPDITIDIPTRYGSMEAFATYPDGDGPFPAVILYMDAPGIREELRNMCRRIAKQGYFVLLPDLYYRLGKLRFDIPRRTDAMSVVIRGAMDSLTNAQIVEDSAGLIAFIDSHEKTKPGLIGSIGYCMSGCFVTSLAAQFPNRIGAAASLYGIGIVTDKPDSPHLLIDQVNGELYFAFAEHDPSVPDQVIAELRERISHAGSRHEVEIFAGTHHGFCFTGRKDYDVFAAEQSLSKIFTMLERTLKSDVVSEKR